MTPEERTELDIQFKELTKNEVAFLKEEEITPNWYGAYVFISSDGNTRLAIDLFLASYKRWLIDNRIVKEA